MNQTRSTVVLTIFAVSTFCIGQTKIDVQEVKELKPTGTLSTCGYTPVEHEKEYLQRLASSEQSTGSFMDKQPYQIRGKVKKYVSWFGIVRAVTPAKGNNHETEVLIQQRYFDGLTDCHIMLVSNAGAGDFVAQINSSDVAVPSLSLVRVYGTIVEERGGVPHVAADYVRVWPWFTFTFTDLGPEDHSNPEWAKYCAICKRSGRIYKPFPTEDYYVGMLGDPKDFLPTPALAH